MDDKIRAAWKSSEHCVIVIHFVTELIILTVAQIISHIALDYKNPNLLLLQHIPLRQVQSIKVQYQRYEENKGLENKS